jgi:ketosteroid isomerase-like protein
LASRTQEKEKDRGSRSADVAIALDGVIVRGERNLLADTALPGIEGARAALETFYYAFNTRSQDLLLKIWADDDLAQLETPLVGLVSGIRAIAAVYGRMASSPVQIKTVLDDIVAYVAPELAVFTERERATSTQDNGATTEELSGRSICIFRFRAEQGGWRLIYHKVSVDGRVSKS